MATCEPTPMNEVTVGSRLAEMGVASLLRDRWPFLQNFPLGHS
jgi:hypothetical protein